MDGFYLRIPNETPYGGIKCVSGSTCARTDSKEERER